MSLGICSLLGHCTECRCAPAVLFWRHPGCHLSSPQGAHVPSFLHSLASLAFGHLILFLRCGFFRFLALWLDSVFRGAPEFTSWGSSTSLSSFSSLSACSASALLGPLALWYRGSARLHQATTTTLLFSHVDVQSPQSFSFLPATPTLPWDLLF